jgi:hypothetical protein
MQEFLDKMDSGELDRSLSAEIKNLSKEQLEELAQVLMSRNTTPRRPG